MANPTVNKNDRPLIEACIKKDLAAWSSLVEKYSSLACISIKNRIKRYGLHVSLHDVEDIRQDVFSDIWKNNKLESVTGRDDISSWIAILSGNAAVEHFRKKGSRFERRTVSLCYKIGAKELCEVIPSEAKGANDELADAELSDKVNETIEALPEKERLMIRLNLIYDKKYHEIAEIMGVPKGTVSSYIKRAKENLKVALKDF